MAGVQRLKSLFRKVRIFFLYELGSFAYALMYTTYLWMGLELIFIMITAYLSSIFGLEEAKMFLVYAILHFFVLLLNAWVYLKLEEGISSMQQSLMSRGLKYTLHSEHWHDLFLTVFSTAVSLYVVALFVAITYVIYPSKLRDSILVPQATLYLGLASYIPLIFELQKIAKINLYYKKFERFRGELIRWEIQQNN